MIHIVYCLYIIIIIILNNTNVINASDIDNNKYINTKFIISSNLKYMDNFENTFKNIKNIYNEYYKYDKFNIYEISYENDNNYYEYDEIIKSLNIFYENNTELYHFFVSSYIIKPIELEKDAYINVNNNYEIYEIYKNFKLLDNNKMIILSSLLEFNDEPELIFNYYDYIKLLNWAISQNITGYKNNDFVNSGDKLKINNFLMILFLIISLCFNLEIKCDEIQNIFLVFDHDVNFYEIENKNINFIQTVLETNLNVKTQIYTCYLKINQNSLIPPIFKINIDHFKTHEVYFHAFEIINNICENTNNFVLNKRTNRYLIITKSLILYKNQYISSYRSINSSIAYITHLHFNKKYYRIEKSLLLKLILHEYGHLLGLPNDNKRACPEIYNNCNNEYCGKNIMGNYKLFLDSDYTFSACSKKYLKN